jgi:hypothetical protein
LKNVIFCFDAFYQLAVVEFAALLTDRYGQLRTITDEVGAPQVSTKACLQRRTILNAVFSVFPKFPVVCSVIRLAGV